MKILVIGGGGREHALVWKLAQSPRVTSLLCAPGNAGTSRHARNVDVQAGDVEGLLALATAEKVDFTVVGPEQPLCAGIVDRFRAAGLRIFGPLKAAAQIEGSKAFAKQVMTRAKAPTAAYRSFGSFDDAKAYLAGEAAFPIVVKATGLAAGKGVVICKTREEATETARRFLVEREFGDASAVIVIEEFLAGEEVSLLCLTDGQSLAPLPAAQDHKRVFDGDEGPNTGGMGAYSPTPFLNEATLRRIEEEILVPVVHEMKVLGAPFRGCLFAGLMLTRSGPRVLEFNARFGDPETQVVLPRLKGDLLELLIAVERGEVDALPPAALEIDPRPCVSVVLAAGGYPGPYRRGDVITGVEDAEKMPDVLVFHAGTALRDGKLVVNGGRVLNVVAYGADYASAAAKAYAAADLIRFPDRHLRRDIAARAIAAKKR
jgi:phosphoribosylamine--glycine ligase